MIVDLMSLSVNRHRGGTSGHYALPTAQCSTGPKETERAQGEGIPTTRCKKDSRRDEIGSGKTS